MTDAGHGGEHLGALIQLGLILGEIRRIRRTASLAGLLYLVFDVTQGSRAHARKVDVFLHDRAALLVNLPVYGRALRALGEQH
jgi:hypothetical protein